ncbi:MAG: alkaline phosphatase [Candidatus Doudnabacteria bacterium]|nr:alkaline phosphatase [Candidatus Doudnabacteria bacterium]
MNTTHLLVLISAYGYAFIFLGTFFEGETIVIAAGFLSKLGILNFWTAMLAAFLGAVSGDNFWYLVGRYGGIRFLHKYGKWIGITQHRINKAHLFFDQHGTHAIFLARFIFGTRLVTAMLAGSSGMQEKKFLKANSAGALLWVSVVGALGYLLAKSFKTLIILVKRIEFILLILALLAIIIVIFRLRANRKNKGNQ